MPSPFGFKFRQRGTALPGSPSLLPARRFAVALSLGLALAGCNQPKASEQAAPDPPASTPFSRALDRTKAAASDLEQRSQEQQQQINGLQGGSP